VLDGLELEGLVVDWLEGDVVSGVVDWVPEVDGEVVFGLLVVVDCELLCELVSGVVLCDVDGELLWATTQTADSNRIAVIRYTFLITSS